MRDIKFRVYNPRDNKVHYDITGFEYIDNGNMTGVFIDGDFFLKEEVELMQYTGLKDKNGKEIYEGDIVKFKHRDITIMASVKYGEWQESKCDEYDCSHYGYYINYKWDNYCENTGFDLYEKIVEVVGNIYENPELLKGEQS